MFDVGFWELLVIGVIALVVVGPERLPGLARTVGLWVGRARHAFYSIRDEIEREANAEGLRDTQRAIRDSVEQTRDQIKSEAGKFESEAGKALNQGGGEADKGQTESGESETSASESGAATQEPSEHASEGTTENRPIEADTKHD